MDSAKQDEAFDTNIEVRETNIYIEEEDKFLLLKCYKTLNY